MQLASKLKFAFAVNWHIKNNKTSSRCFLIIGFQRYWKQFISDFSLLFVFLWCSRRLRGFGFERKCHFRRGTRRKLIEDVTQTTQKCIKSLAIVRDDIDIIISHLTKFEIEHPKFEIRNSKLYCARYPPCIAKGIFYTGAASITLIGRLVNCCCAVLKRFLINRVTIININK